MILQLDPMVPVWTERGEGYAVLVTDYSQEHNRLWTVALDSDGSLWDFPQAEIKFCWNFSLERRK
jgi:hypothetical protein